MYIEYFCDPKSEHDTLNTVTCTALLLQGLMAGLKINVYILQSDVYNFKSKLRDIRRPICLILEFFKF